MSSILGFQPSKRRPFPFKTRGPIWVPGVYIYNYFPFGLVNFQGRAVKLPAIIYIYIYNIYIYIYLYVYVSTHFSPSTKLTNPRFCQMCQPHLQRLALSPDPSSPNDAPDDSTGTGHWDRLNKPDVGPQSQRGPPENGKIPKL